MDKLALSGLDREIRHQIDTSASEVWLPLQDSLAMQFEVPSRQALEQIWVEKERVLPRLLASIRFL